MIACHYCQRGFPPADVRPYGPGGEMVCYPCAMLSANFKTTGRRFDEVMMATVRDDVEVVVFTDTGPKSFDEVFDPRDGL